MPKDCKLCEIHPECNGVVTLGPDPFQQEINDDHTEVWMCAGERYESAMDI